jgi:hypothetical protein
VLVYPYWDKMPQEDDDNRGKSQHSTQANEEWRYELNSCTEGFGICPPVGFDLSKELHQPRNKISTFRTYMVETSRNAVQRAQAVRMKNDFCIDDP